MRPIPKISLLLLIVFCLMLVIGINLDEAKVVLEKATEICLSCIGIG